MTPRTDYDVWRCTTCHREWVTPSLPHNSQCPTCGAHGWWQRFQQGEPYEVAQGDPAGPVRVAGPPRRVRCRCKNKDRHFGVCKCHRHKGDTVQRLEVGLGR